MMQQQQHHHSHCGGTTAKRLFGYSSIGGESHGGGVFDPTETVLPLDASPSKKQGGWIRTYLNMSEEEHVHSPSLLTSPGIQPEAASKSSPNRRQSGSDSGGRRPGNPHASELDGFCRKWMCYRRSICKLVKGSLIDFSVPYLYCRHQPWQRFVPDTYFW